MGGTLAKTNWPTTRLSQQEQEALTRNVVHFRGDPKCKIQVNCLVCGKIRFDDKRVAEWSDPNLTISNFLENYRLTDNNNGIDVGSMHRYVNLVICNEQFCCEQLYIKTGGYNDTNLTMNFPHAQVEEYIRGRGVLPS